MNVPHGQQGSLANSALWNDLRRFYETKGPAAWNVDGVPNHVTINPGFATRYAHVALRYAQDCRRLGHATGRRPFPVVELGAGIGGFGYRLAGALDRLRAALGLDGLPLSQVMSDLAAANVGSWRVQPDLAPLITQGRVVAEAFDVLSGDTVGAVGREPVDPPVFMANYLFDSLPMDVFRVTRGQLFVGLVEAGGLPAAEAEPQSDQGLGIAWSYQPVELPYYGDPALDATLADCIGQVADDYWVLFPVGAMRSLKRLSDLAGGPMLLIAADLGTSEEPAFFEREPELSGPGRYFYAPVDFALLGRYAARLGGEARHHVRDRVLNVSLFSFGIPFDRLHETSVAADTFFDMVPHTLIAGTMSHMQSAGVPPPLPLFLDLASAGSFDPSLIDAMAGPLAEEFRAGTHPPALWAQLRAALDRFAGNVFVNGGPKAGGVDSLYVMACLLQQMQEYSMALDFFQRSIERFGETAEHLYNMALCAYLAGDQDTALDRLHRVMDLDPYHVLARGWIAQIGFEQAKAVPEPALA